MKPRIPKKYRKQNKYTVDTPDSKCYACNGSGYYDHTGSPKCSSCNGTGKRRVGRAVDCASFEN